MEMDERNLSRSARRKMAQRARKTAKKRAIRRKSRAKRMKTRGQLSSAAEKVAKNILVKKMTGGKKYGQLSIGQKEMVDKKIAKKPGLVKTPRFAKNLGLDRKTLLCECQKTSV